MFKGYAMDAQWYRPKVLVILLHFFRSRGISSLQKREEFSGIRSCYSAQAGSTKRILENNDTIWYHFPPTKLHAENHYFWRRVVFQPPTVGRIYVSWGISSMGEDRYTGLTYPRCIKIDHSKYLFDDTASSRKAQVSGGLEKGLPLSKQGLTHRVFQTTKRTQPALIGGKKTWQLKNTTSSGWCLLHISREP